MHITTGRPVTRILVAYDVNANELQCNVSLNVSTTVTTATLTILYVTKQQHGELNARASTASLESSTKRHKRYKNTSAVPDADRDGANKTPTGRG